MTSLNVSQSGSCWACVLTPRGRGAVATIRFEGRCALIDAARPALFRAANSQPLERQQVGRIVFGRWGEPVPEEVVVCRIDETTLEIHCHGGDAAAGRIASDLHALGCRIETWEESLARRSDTLAAECAECLAQATTVRTGGMLLEQHSGTLRRALEELLERIPAFEGSTTESLESGRTDLLGRIDSLLRWSNFGPHLTTPWQVVLAGRPNVGKSSLMNALLGYSRSIVFDQPGTTRDALTAETALEGWPVVLTDTAGLRDEADELETAGIALAENRLQSADCRVLLWDISVPPCDEDLRLFERWPEAILVAHKSDLLDVWGEELPAAALRVSSLAGTGLEELSQTIVAKLVPHVPTPGTAIPITDRQVALLQAARAALENGNWKGCHDAVRQVFTG